MQPHGPSIFPKHFYSSLNAPKDGTQIYKTYNFFVFFLISGIPGHHDNPLGYVCMSGHVMLFHMEPFFFFANTEDDRYIYERSILVVVLNKDAVNTCCWSLQVKRPAL